MKIGECLHSINQRTSSANTRWASGLSGRALPTNARFKPAHTLTSRPLPCRHQKLSDWSDGTARELGRVQATRSGLGISEERERVSWEDFEQTARGDDEPSIGKNGSSGSQHPAVQSSPSTPQVQRRGKQGRTTRSSSFEEDAEALELVASGYYSQANLLGGRTAQRANGSGPSGQYLEGPSNSSREASDFWDEKGVPERKDWSDWHRRSSGRQAGPRSAVQEYNNQRKPVLPRRTVGGVPGTSTDQVHLFCCFIAVACLSQRLSGHARPCFLGDYACICFPFTLRSRHPTKCGPCVLTCLPVCQDKGRASISMPPTTCLVC